MKRMKLILLVLMAIVLFSAALASCGEPSPETTTESICTTTEAPITTEEPWKQKIEYPDDESSVVYNEETEEYSIFLTFEPSADRGYEKTAKDFLATYRVDGSYNDYYETSIFVNATKEKIETYAQSSLVRAISFVKLEDAWKLKIQYPYDLDDVVYDETTKQYGVRLTFAERPDQSLWDTMSAFTDAHSFRDYDYVIQDIVGSSILVHATEDEINAYAKSNLIETVSFVRKEDAWRWKYDYPFDIDSIAYDEETGKYRIRLMLVDHLPGGYEEAANELTQLYNLDSSFNSRYPEFIGVDATMEQIELYAQSSLVQSIRFIHKVTNSEESNE